MRVLLDTNILIPREDFAVVPSSVQRLLVNLSASKVQMLVHPLSLTDLSHDRNDERRQVVSSKISSYPQLSPYPDFRSDEDFKKAVRWDGDSGLLVDLELLYAVYKNSVDLLITQDLEIHRRAVWISVDTRVLDIEEATRSFQPIEEWRSVTASLQEVDLWSVDVGDPIFDDLKKEYPRFENWFRDKCREGSRAIINRLDDGGIGAILMLKEENESIPSVPPLPAKPRLKIRTFKVANRGNYLGELFIRIAVDRAFKTDRDEIYFTHFSTDFDPLANLTYQFGFERSSGIVWPDGRIEDVYVKNMFSVGPVTGTSALEIDRRYFPSFCDGPLVRKCVVPILPQFHKRLFGGRDEAQSTLDLFTGGFIPEQNTILKAYLCRSRTRVSPGDVMLIYRSHDARAITSIGVIESAHYDVRDASEIRREVSKRTVYSQAEINDFAEKGATVVLFRHCMTLGKPVDSVMMKRAGVSPPRTISLIPQEAYEFIIRRGGLDRRFTIR